MRGPSERANIRSNALLSFTTAEHHTAKPWVVVWRRSTYVAVKTLASAPLDTSRAQGRRGPADLKCRLNAILGEHTVAAELRFGEYNKGVAFNHDLLRSLRSARIHDRRVLEAFASVPREQFVPAEWRDQAYEDVPLPIRHNQVTTQPSLIARMIEGLRLSGGERVLEVGTGCGFQTALLAVCAGEVWSVERWPDIAADAIGNLARYGVENARVVVGDGSLGLPEHAPFDRILVAAAFPSVPPPLAKQLANGGRLVQPIGPGGREEVTAFVREGLRLRIEEVLTGANFVRMVGAHGFRE